MIYDRRFESCPGIEKRQGHEDFKGRNVEEERQKINWILQLKPLSGNDIIFTGYCFIEGKNCIKRSKMVVRPHSYFMNGVSFVNIKGLIIKNNMKEGRRNICLK